MKVTLAQIAPKLNRTNLKMHIDLIQENMSNSDVIVFPELSLSGYMLQDKVYEEAWRVDELSELVALSSEVDIIVGAALEERAHVYNALLYMSGGEIIHTHRKVHLPNYGMFEEARFFSKGDEVVMFETKYGSVATVICEDLWRSSTIEHLSVLKPDIIYVPSNSPARDFNNSGLLIEEQWEAILKTTALLSGAYIVFVNRVGFEDGMGFWGGSRIITPIGEVEMKLELFKDSVDGIVLNHALYRTEKIMMKR